MGFNMRVLNIFNLSNGRTVFAGEIEGHPDLIKPCICELRSGEVSRGVVEIEGEQIVKKADPQNKLRALATVKNVELTKKEAESGDWELVAVQASDETRDISGAEGVQNSVSGDN